MTVVRMIAAAICCALLAPAAASAQARAPVIQASAARPVAAHVLVIPDDGVPLTPNVGVVVGQRGVLVVDTGLGPRNGEAVLEATRKAAPGRTIYIVSTHFHPEHDLGAQAFPADARMIRSKDQEADIAEFGLQLAQVFASRSPAAAELLKDADFRKADIVFDDEHRIDLGGVSVRILAMGPNHTRGDTAVLVEPDKVLFTGDIAMLGLPAFASPYSSLTQWLLSLDRLEALEPGQIVPSHGPMGDVGFIKTYRAYLTEIRDRTAAERKAGKSLEETTATVTADMAKAYPNTGRMAGAIKAAYAEAR